MSNLVEKPKPGELAQCPWCAAGETTIEGQGRIWGGMGYGEPTTWVVRHWCTPRGGQPSRMIERAGRDRASAVASWNRRERSVMGIQSVLMAIQHGGISTGRARELIEQWLAWGRHDPLPDCPSIFGEDDWPHEMVIQLRAELAQCRNANDQMGA